MDGILVIDKPEGITSHDVVNSVRRITLTRKVGHAGTLDPFASGVLVVGVNQGTKALAFLKSDDKEYDAVVRLGIETDTLDREGRVVRESACPVMGREEVVRILNSFLGKQSQIPPDFSAIKKNGMPLYKLARKGIKIEAAPREIYIHGISDVSVDMPDISFKVTCSSGTYIRGLARDIGNKAGCGAHLRSLRRLRSGRFSIEQAVSLERLIEKPDRWVDAAMSLTDALSLTEVKVENRIAEMIRNGRKLTPEDTGYKGPLSGLFMVICDSSLIAVGQMAGSKEFDILRVFNR